LKLIQRCIWKCSLQQSRWTRYRAERLCARALGDSNIDKATADAARRIGEWLGKQ